MLIFFLNSVSSDQHGTGIVRELRQVCDVIGINLLFDEEESSAT